MSKNYIDLINIANPEKGFGGYVNKTVPELSKQILHKQPFILHMLNGNKLIVSEEVLSSYLAIILDEKNVKKE